MLAVQTVRERLHRATQAMAKAGIPYAVVGGNAVAAWVIKADEGGERKTPNVDILVRRSDFPVVATALQEAGFCQRVAAESVRFVDGPDGKLRSGVQILFAGERFRSNYLLPLPDVEQSTKLSVGQVLNLEPLVLSKLNSYRTIDQVHILDMIDVGLVDATWLPKLPPQLASRLQELLDNPDG